LTWCHDHSWLRSEFDWLATDQTGRVALISTAGVGPVPQTIADQPDYPENMQDQLLLLLPVLGVARLADAYPREWAAIAERGVWVYDWSHTRRAYLCQVSPSSAVYTDALPEVVRNLASMALLPVRFAKKGEILP
jgi:hypothetical protein